MGISINTQYNPYAYMYSQGSGNPASVNANASNNPLSMSKTSQKNDSSPETQALKRAGKVECQTCKNRQYQDGSNDPGVSFKTPGHIDPGSSASVVMSHEQEHVRNETAKASSEGRKVVSQSVSLETSVCPECGRVYVSGGKTRTVTKTDSKNSDKELDKYFGKFLDVKT
ncbi:MAG TPA: hypothetical protein VHT34_00205 [Clostridia bacterium]|nr:hypothetical protein [Clostridia bacterium]